MSATVEHASPAVAAYTGPATIHRAAVEAYDPDATPVNLVDLLDRVLARGVVLTGEITISIAGIDLVHLSLRALLSAVRPGLFGPVSPIPKPPTELEREPS